MAEQKDLFKPLKEIKFVDRNTLNPNDYNPNKVLEKNLELLTQSILTNGFCFPIVVRPDMTIIDGFHRWTVSGREPNADLAFLYYDTDMFRSNKQGRKHSEKKDYKKILSDAIKKATENPSNYADFDTAKKLLSKMILPNYPNAVYQKVYQILIAGDPKKREYRAILSRINKENSNG
ncbi:ParB N-terminal domain-containing protein [Riemerella columbina]|uniref:ParB N-terminal domain-containing protein n=1 Tax=Riemerella columbina TaxID=103810 RepID=UPI00037E8BDF|nr:ParB N-terminal domain-containing protein [Riemerella columbina]